MGKAFQRHFFNDFLKREFAFFLLYFWIVLNRPVITFLLKYLDEAIRVETYHGEFRNLMVLINEKIFVEDFGECKGIGRCGTCLVSIESGNQWEVERNEAATLQKAGVNDKNWRLSCQIMIDERLEGAEITIAEERMDVR